MAEGYKNTFVDINTFNTEMNNKWTKTLGGISPSNFYLFQSVRFGWDPTINAICLDGIFSDGTIQRIGMNSNVIFHSYYNGTTWSDQGSWTKD